MMMMMMMMTMMMMPIRRSDGGIITPDYGSEQSPVSCCPTPALAPMISGFLSNYPDISLLPNFFVTQCVYFPNFFVTWYICCLTGIGTNDIRLPIQLSTRITKIYCEIYQYIFVAQHLCYTIFQIYLLPGQFWHQWYQVSLTAIKIYFRLHYKSGGLYISYIAVYLCCPMTISTLIMMTTMTIIMMAEEDMCGRLSGDYKRSTLGSVINTHFEFNDDDWQIW